MIILKILFENTTKYSKDIYNKFLAFHSKKYRFTYVSYTVIIVALILFCLTLQVKYHNFTIAVVFCSVLTVFILWRLFKPISDVSKEYKSEKIQSEKEFTFKFYDNFFTVEDNNEYIKMNYFQLYKVFETQDFFYLYIDKRHSFLIEKSKFKSNASTSFSCFIKKKCWWKYRLYHKFL